MTISIIIKTKGFFLEEEGEGEGEKEGEGDFIFVIREFCTRLCVNPCGCIGITVLNASLRSISLHPPSETNTLWISSRVFPLANSPRMYPTSSGVIINFFITI